MNKVQAGATAAGAGGGAVIAWAWNTFVPQHQMPVEVAAAAAPIIGHVIAWAVGWFNAPPQKAE